MKIEGVEGMTVADVVREKQQGSRFVVYQYCISLLIVTFKRGSDIHFIKSGQSALAGGIPYTLLSLLLGWWGIPWGPIYTLQSLAVNLTGGKDVTKELVASITAMAPAPEERRALQGLLDRYHDVEDRGPTPVTKCSTCGSPLGPSDPSCATCGTAVQREPRTLRFALLVGAGAIVLVGTLAGLSLWKPHPPASAPSADVTEVPIDTPSPTNTRTHTRTPDPDMLWWACTESPRGQMNGILFDEVLDRSLTAKDSCSKMRDWLARLRQLRTAYDECPSPANPKAVQLHAYEEEMYDEYIVVIDMTLGCCATGRCDYDAVQPHLNRIDELTELIVALADEP
jgi:hypothetical protein